MMILPIISPNSLAAGDDKFVNDQRYAAVAANDALGSDRSKPETKGAKRLRLFAGSVGFILLAIAYTAWLVYPYMPRNWLGQFGGTTGGRRLEL